MTSAGMPIREAVALVRNARGPNDIVIPSMGSAREWMALGPLHDLDFVLVPSAMGHATSVGLGLALAQPERRVLVLSGDGSLLMNLGSLVTIGAQAPKNLVIVLFVNGVYEVTGAQATPGASVDYVAIARASGIRTVFRFSALEDWSSGIASALGSAGPALVILDVAPVPGAIGPRSPGPTGPRVERFMRSLRT